VRAKTGFRSESHTGNVDGSLGIFDPARSRIAYVAHVLKEGLVRALVLTLGVGHAGGSERSKDAKRGDLRKPGRKGRRVVHGIPTTAAR